MCILDRSNSTIRPQTHTCVKINSFFSYISIIDNLESEIIASCQKNAYMQNYVLSIREFTDMKIITLIDFDLNGCDYMRATKKIFLVCLNAKEIGLLQSMCGRSQTQHFYLTLEMCSKFSCCPVEKNQYNLWPTHQPFPNALL